MHFDHSQQRIPEWPCSMPAVKSICQHQHPKPLDLQWSICIAVLSAKATVRATWPSCEDIYIVLKQFACNLLVEQTERFITNHTDMGLRWNKHSNHFPGQIHMESETDAFHLLFLFLGPHFLVPGFGCFWGVIS